MLGIERIHSVGRLLTRFDSWVVHEMLLDPDKMAWLWKECQKYPTLFSDLTRGSYENFLALFESPNTFWMEVYDGRNLVGLIYLMKLDQVTDVEVHVLFFDRMLADKVGLCREVARWIFKEFKPHRLSASMPVIYHAVIRLAKKIGFRVEGVRRESALLGGKWVDELQLGLLASELD